MPIPRKFLVDDDRPGCFHLISRCVRRAFLCGDAAEPRRAWVRDLIHQAAGAFAIDVLAYAVMSNHLHTVVRTDPERVRDWTAAFPAEVVVTGLTVTSATGVVLSHDDPDGDPIISRAEEALSALPLRLVDGTLRFTLPPHAVVFLSVQ